jgi:hypothetical protein
MQHAVPLKRWRSTTLGVNCGRIPPPRRRIESKEHDRLISGALAGLDTPLRGYLVTWPRISPPLLFSGWTLKHSFPASSSSVGLSVRKGGHSFLLGSQRDTRAKLNPGNAFR